MTIRIFTDGSCLGNPGPGAWAYLIRIDGKEHRAEGGEPYTTNNRMELTAVIEALKWLTEHHPAETDMEIASDSSWVINTLTKNWKRKKNLDLWDTLAPYLFEKNITWKWVRGHNGHKENEDCDRRAQAEAQRQQKIYE
jgi:ribonuclease HI